MQHEDPSSSAQGSNTCLCSGRTKYQPQDCTVSSISNHLHTTFKLCFFTTHNNMSKSFPFSLFPFKAQRCTKLWLSVSHLPDFGMCLWTYKWEHPDVLGIYFKHNSEATLWWLGQQGAWTAHSSSHRTLSLQPIWIPSQASWLRLALSVLNESSAPQLNFAFSLKLVSSKRKELSNNLSYEEQKSTTPSGCKEGQNSKYLINQYPENKSWL